MKSAQAAENKAITGNARTHIISRLNKAYKTAQVLLEAISDQPASGASDSDILEARAYVASLGGAEHFEKQSWESCVRYYSTAWIIYTALASSTKSDTFKELLTTTIEPSIKYGAYQMKLPRSLAISTIARKFFPIEDESLVTAVEKLNPSILKDVGKTKAAPTDAEAVAKSITWRSRTVNVEDASIVASLSAMSNAAKKLEQTLSSSSTSHPREHAAAYDDILIASQDAIDTTKQSIDELIAERVAQGDKRVQNLQITRTAIGYDLISWRIGRNRVLTGSNDGAVLESSPIAKAKRRVKGQATAEADKKVKEEGNGRKLARLRERVVLYDSTLQSIDSIKELPGVASDERFLEELNAKYTYFRALKCLAIARSHSLLGSYKEALALLNRAVEVFQAALPLLNGTLSPSSPPNFAISSSSASFLAQTLQTELQRHRALVEISHLSASAKVPVQTSPLVENLDRYPPNGEVDLTRLVNYPPKIEAVPVKPLFFDVAWNYIEYPGKGVQNEPVQSRTSEDNRPRQPQQAEAPTKKGWFGFSRS